MGGRRSLMPKISGGEITFQYFLRAATLIMNGQTECFSIYYYFKPMFVLSLLYFFESVTMKLQILS
jgi:hypothetical protein